MVKRSANEAFREPRVVNFDQSPARKLKEPPLAPSGSDLKEKAANLLYQRKTLPIYQHASTIRSALRQNNVLLLSGETGSGKSTQIPQFLVNEPWCKGRVAITQPRRVAAITLAKRVADEMGTPLGKSSPASTVGYAVRFDHNTSPNTKVKFLTEGMLLQEMLRDAELKEYSCVVVDEVHERGVNVDLILGFLRLMLQGARRDLKVVVMSATADMGRLKDFFGGDSDISAIVSNGHHQDNIMSDETKAGPLLGSDDRDRTLRGGELSRTPITLKIKGRQYPVQTIYTSQPVTNWIDSAFERVVDLHLHQRLPGDILVFLTGQETVETLQALCNDFAASLKKTGEYTGAPNMLVLPLFAALPQHAQQRVFQPTPPKTRKVILATNIAETSVTVPGVRYVIDNGKCKKKQFRSQLNLDSLLVKSTSRSSANQRKGRAGREAAGICYRLYTEADYLKFAADNDPEILRCDLSQVVLTLKARNVEDVSRFPWLTSPRQLSLERAVVQLLQLEALDLQQGSVTSLGREMALLPLPANLARVLLASSQPELNCMAECIDIISALSVENVFLNTHLGGTEEQREAVEAARRTLYRREGDHLTLLTTVQTYAEENVDRKRWCEEHFVNHRAMQAVMDVRKQLTSITSKNRSGVLEGKPAHYDDAMTLPDRILRTFMRGFGSNIATLVPDGSYKTLVGGQTIAVHPSSVLFGRKVEAIMYNEFVFTQRAYARGVSAVEMRWLEV